MQHHFFRKRSLALLSMLVPLLLASALGGFLPRPAAPAPAHAAAVDPAVYQALAAAPDGQAAFFLYLGPPPDLAAAASVADWARRGQAVYQTLRGAAEASQAGLLARQRAGAIPGQISRFQPFWIANAIFVAGDRTALEALARQPEVLRILPELRLDPPEPVEGDAHGQASPQAVEWGVQKIGAPTVWAAPYSANGQGIVIGVVDTGVKWDHAALKAHYRGWNAGAGAVDHNYNWYNPDPAHTCDDTATGTCDWHGHGTHVTGTTSGDDGGANQIGVAPGAKWIHALGCCPDNAALLGTLQWMAAPTDLAGNNPNPALRPNVINNSWGGPGGSLIFEDAIAALRAAGVVPVFSAGNNGLNGCGSLGAPGDNPSAFNVGSTNSSDAIASSSSRGPDPFSGATGPHVSAPGVSIRSSTRNGGYGVMSGTSMASPHVAGAVALLLSAEPDLIGQVDQVEEILRRTALPLTSGQTCGGVPGSQTPNNTYGWGRIDVAAAVQMAWQAGLLSGVISDAATGAPIAGATVAVTRNGDTLTQGASASGAFSLILGSGSYQVTVSAFGYQATWPLNLQVLQDQTSTQNFALNALPTAAVSGVVTSASLRAQPAAPGDPVAGAAVELLGAAGPLLSAVTLADGSYTLPNVPYGSHTLRLSAPGFQTQLASITVSGPTAQNLTAQPAADYAVDAGDLCSAAYQWIDATGGTAHLLGDDAYVAVALPAPFTFYGAAYNTLFISSNGFVSFGQGYSLWHGIIPFEGIPNNVITALGDDLNPDSGAQGTIYSKTLPDGRFVVEYHQVEHWASGNPETFEIILDPADGSIVLQYQVVSWPDYTNVGVENLDGSRGRAYSYANDPPITPGLAVKFMPFSGGTLSCAAPQAPDVTISQPAGSDVLLTWQHLPANAHYQVWRSTAPYFDPGQGEGSQVGALLAAAGGLTFEDAGAAGDPASNHFYLVLGAWGAAVSGPSNQVAEFDFELVPGN